MAHQFQRSATTVTTSAGIAINFRPAESIDRSRTKGRHHAGCRCCRPLSLLMQKNLSHGLRRCPDRGLPELIATSVAHVNYSLPW